MQDFSKIYQNHIKGKLLTNQEENDLIKIIYEDLENDVQKKVAINKLITANLKLVVFIAKQYTNRGLDLMDLIQEGNLGLMKAIDHFNHRLGYKFSNYAYSCIKRTITRSLINKSKTIRIPIEILKIINNFSVNSNKLQPKDASNVTTTNQSMNLSDAEILEIMMINKPPISLATPVNESLQTIGDFIADSNTIDPNLLSTNEELSEWLKKLTPKESKIIKMRFGIDAKHDHTLTEIGNAFGVSREQIRQLEIKALQKLRHIAKASN